METNCVPLGADLFLFMKSLTKEKRYDLIDALNSTSRYLDDLLNIDNVHFEHMVHRIYPAEFQLNRANASDTEAAFLDLNLSIHNDIVSTKIYDKRDDFNFDIVNFPFLDGDVPKRPYYGVYILKRKSFATLTKMLVPFFGPKQSLSDNAVDKSLYLPCIQHKNQNGLAYGYRAATIILRLPQIFKSQGYNTSHVMRNNFF